VSQPDTDPSAHASAAGEGRYLPVPAGEAAVEAAPPRPIERAQPVPLPVAVAAAATGFLAGVATFVLVRVLRRHRAERALGRVLSRRGRGRGGLEIAGSRSFLVDIHLLRR
jgi:hypothetical protein